MLKHRDNLSYPPFTVDPKGNGVTTVGSNSTGEQQQQEAPNDINVAAGTSAVAGKKRNRDIRGLDRFKQVVYGEKGLPRFHAMVSRHPVLMYPPEGTDIARRKALAERKEKAAQQPTVRNPQQPSWSPDDDTLSMFDETRIEEEDLQSALNYMDSHALQDTVAHRDGNGVATPEAPSASNNDNVTDGDGNRAKDLGNDFAAKYHHRQLDALVGLYYEFNHLTFMKLPMNDTLQLLRRCGRSGTAQVMEYEGIQRNLRNNKLQQLHLLAEDERMLDERTREIERQALEMEFQEATREHDTIDTLEKGY